MLGSCEYGIVEEPELRFVCLLVQLYAMSDLLYGYPLAWKVHRIVFVVSILDLLYGVPMLYIGSL